MPELLNHITDEKTISARQCVKALGIIAKQRPQYKSVIAYALNEADLSKYKDSMRPLIMRDIAEALKEINAGNG